VRPSTGKVRRYPDARTAALYAAVAIAAIVALWMYLSGTLDEESDPFRDCLGPARWCQHLRDADTPGVASDAPR
jgi:hypothetical protein